MLKSTDGIVTVLSAKGQYQVVIGNHVGDVFESVCDLASIHSNKSEDSDEEKMGVVATLVDTLSETFFPILGTLAGVGIIKGLLAIGVFLNVLDASGGTYEVLYAAGNAFFYFLPIMLAMTAAEKFGSDKFVALAIGAALCYPSLVNLTSTDAIGVAFRDTMFATDYYSTFMGMPLLLPSGGYPNSVVPAIVAVYFDAKLEKRVTKLLPASLKMFFVPLIVVSITVALTYLIIGPVVSLLTSIVGKFFLNMYSANGIIAGGLTGGVFSILIIFGLHWGLVPLALNSLGTYGFDNIIPTSFSVTFAQGVAALAVYLKSKDKALKKIALPAFISSMMGVSEPAIYGVTLPKKKPFVGACIGTAIGGMLAGGLGIRRCAMGGLGWFALPTYINPETGSLNDVLGLLASVMLSCTVTFIITYLTYKDEVVVETEGDTQHVSDNLVSGGENSIEIVSPMKGLTMPLEKIEDKVFAEGALGLGIAILPEEGKVYSPASGVVSVFFPTGHAIVIETEDGAQVLIHLGMDTVELAGKYFDPKVKVGDQVKKGQLILEFDKELIEKEGYSMMSPVVISNTTDFLDIVLTENRKVDTGELLITVL